MVSQSSIHAVFETFLDWVRFLRKSEKGENLCVCSHRKHHKIKNVLKFFLFLIQYIKQCLRQEVIE